MTDDQVTIKPRDNGPYLVQGPVKLIDVDGKEFQLTGETIALCRCGQSSTKPFCDGTHKKVEFQSVVRADASEPAAG